MRIDVVGADTISQQARTYAEYRVFAALTQFVNAETVRRARVALRPLDRGHGCDSIACTVTVSLEGADSIRIRATGPHAYAAINRAVERIRSTAATFRLKCRHAWAASGRLRRSRQPHDISGFTRDTIQRVVGAVLASNDV